MKGWMDEWTDWKRVISLALFYLRLKLTVDFGELFEM